MLEQEEKFRAKPTLENMFRMSFHLKGCYDFIDGVNTELELSPIQFLIGKGIGHGLDIMKYITYA